MYSIIYLGYWSLLDVAMVCQSWVAYSLIEEQRERVRNGGAALDRSSQIWPGKT